MAVKRVLAGLGALTASLALVSLAPGTAAAADTVAFTIPDSRITHSSGLARDPGGNIYWTANDSEASGVAYGLTTKGKVRGSLSFRVQPQDVEAVAVHGDRLYLADIGDHKAKRKHVTVYYLNHPRATGLTVDYHSWDLRYPDGAHDAETLLVNGSGRMFIVTKGVKGGIYEAPKSPSRKKVNKLARVGSAPAMVTDGTFLPDGKGIALLSHTLVTVVDAKTYATVTTAPIPHQPQAESLTVSLDDKFLLVGSEGKKSKVYAIAIPSAEGPSGTPTDSTGGDDQGDDPDDDTTTTPGLHNAGTLLAVGLAGFVAVVAGVVVAVVRKP
jgi:hypothetical protein